ncbi:uncharacterized protein SPSK_03271 [Sporothrix schenckii 1099-18]|uniref:Uncharacterized protein n=1 Tax=Sporothrix schenckii 1099-18 TaxID=1397361 RepID=A0A0F2M239_SPOSC|nr:uncharacterized protein SPSK_03271 [Sporothrix schenckii 1099-18]KJR82201.1 hypothetical protein SPSK_03271 [Sporothrix schenckii 1099-18]
MSSSSAAARTATTASTTSREFLDELYELLERDKNKKNTVILELILQQWQQIGDEQMAHGVAEEILKRDTSHPGAREYIRKSSSQVTTPASTIWSSWSLGTSSRSTSASSASRPDPLQTRLPHRPPRGGGSTAGTPVISETGSVSTSSGTRHLDPKAAMAARLPASSGDVLGAKRKNKRPVQFGSPLSSETERLAVEVKLEQQFADLQARATELEREMVVLENVGLVDNAEIFQDTRNIKHGRVSLVVMPAMPRPVRQLVRELQGDRKRCLDLIIDDFVEVAQWSLEDDTTGKPHIDVVRDRLLRRQTLLDAMLPAGLEDLGRTAMMLVEHQLIDHGKKYANDKTMLFEDVADIPVANLLVTSDNYAWDMSELADALAVNSGVMRNPITRDMFSEEDVRQILNHPLGERLRPMALEQSELKRGVRSTTIDRMAHLSKVMLEDQSAHATPTIEAIDIFMAYFHTLPDAEKRTLKSLKVPAKDSHTGQAYDSAILEAIQDAKANRVCYHKVGDFLSQAAKKLQDDL